MRQFFKRLLLPIAVAAVTQTSIVSAESIRLIGPGGEVQSAPQFSSDIVRNRATTSDEPLPLVGPTSEKDTLWSIATRLRPSTQVSVQQTLLAIYRLNPKAFENQNIHSLIPGSTLRIPSLAQVSSVSTQEAVNVMAAHKARLTNQPVVTTPRPTAKVVAPVVEAKTQPSVEAKAETDPISTTAPAAVKQPVSDVKPDMVKMSTSAPEGELLALEEKNHRLRLMLSQVQDEVSGLKQELGDENRIRSEVEKLLEEERIKREELQRLAPSQWDELLANNWVVAGLALIPGLFIALIVMLLLGRRPRSNQPSPSATQDTQLNTTPTMDAPVAAIAVGEQATDDLDDELLLDDDLFGSMDDSDLLFGEEETKSEPSGEENKDDDMFAELDDSDLDFDLEGEGDEDLFAAIDDSGDLDTDFGDLSSSNNGISVNSEEKALGLEEMERALDQASQDSAQEDDDVGFDLSDDGEMSQSEIESLLAADDDSDDMESTLDQSMLDELLAEQEEDSEELLDFGSLLDDGKSSDGNKKDTEDNDEFGNAAFASDDDIDSLFANIEAQADLEQLEANSYDETALLDELLDDSPKVEADSSELLNELLDETSSDEHLEDDSDDDIMSELDELIGASGKSDVPDIDEDSTDLLDDFLDELDPEPAGYDSFLADTDSDDSKDEGIALFDELLDIEQHAAENDQDFNSENFIDDLINNAPETDPLLDEAEFEIPAEAGVDLDDFEFNPEIEGTEEPAEPEEKPVPIANEFGVPQDDDWTLDEETSAKDVVEQDGGLTNQAESSDASEVVTEETVSGVQGELSEDEANIDSAIDTSVPDTDVEDILAQFGMSESVEDNIEAEALASDAKATEPESEQEPKEVETATQDGAEVDDFEFPEFTEQDALAEAPQDTAAEETEPAVELEGLDTEANAEEPEEAEALASDAKATEPESEQEPKQVETATQDGAEVDDLEFPEFTEQDALAEAPQDTAAEETEPAVELEGLDKEANAEEPEEAEELATEEKATELEQEPEQEPEVAEAELDDFEFPEFTEEDALADSDWDESQEDIAPESSDETIELDEFELPEYTEDDALADSLAAPESSTEIDPPSQAAEPKTTEVNLSEVARQEFDEKALSDWLSEDEPDEKGFTFDAPMDAKSIDSAGMDIDAMLEVGGEDWNGFSLTPDQKATIPDEVPEAERDVWVPEIQVKEPEVAEENWEHQEELDEFDPAKSQFMTIDDLMAQVDREDDEIYSPDDEELKLDVGLNEFPDVIGDVSDVDVDSNSEAAGKLDLAQIYVEMNDDKGAIKLLEEAIVDGSDEIRRQAKHLIDVINGRV